MFGSNALFVRGKGIFSNNGTAGLILDVRVIFGLLLGYAA